MKLLLVVFILFLYCGDHLIAKDKELSVLKILYLDTEAALKGEAYKNIF
jgi:hypothetical protein